MIEVLRRCVVTMGLFSGKDRGVKDVFWHPGLVNEKTKIRFSMNGIAGCNAGDQMLKKWRILRKWRQGI